MGNEVYGAFNHNPDRWVIDPDCTDATDPDCYTKDTGGATLDCLEGQVICGIEAPDNGGEPAIPTDSDLYEDLQNEDYSSNPDIFTMLE